MCTPRAKLERAIFYGVHIRLILSFQSLKWEGADCLGAQRTLEVGLILTFFDRKNFSHRRTNFPSNSLFSRPAVSDQGMRKFEAKQVIAVHMGNAYGAGAQGSGSLRERIS